MEFERLFLEGLILAIPRAFEDERGFFMESYRADAFASQGVNAAFVQENHSRSKKNVLRGLHFQVPPHAQDKLVRVVRGEVLDVAVDLRTGSPTFGKWEAVRLSEANHRILFIPKGFAHGFLTLSETADLVYKVSAYYAPSSERGLIWNDPDLGIDWGIEAPILSPKDREYPRLNALDPTFAYGA